MNEQELNDKIKKIVEAVKGCGVTVTSVDIGTNVSGNHLLGSIIPHIYNLELVVKIGLKLETKDT